VNPRFLNKLKNKNLTLFVALFFLLILVASLTPFLKSPLLNILKYPLKLSTLVRREIGGIIFYHRNFIQNERFQKELDLYKQKLNSTNELYLENIRLKSLLSLRKNSPYKVVAAEVIASSPDSWSSIITINKGKNYGIKRNMTVITYLGLAGRVIETTDSTSKVMLINDPDLSVSCLSQRSRQEGLVSGTLGSFLMMRYLPKEADIEAGDIIITSGLTDLYPKGLLVGTVIEVGEELSGLARYAVVKPAVNLYKIEEVLIIVQKSLSP
jgi:rod shape-determining protein MreC